MCIGTVADGCIYPPVEYVPATLFFLIVSSGDVFHRTVQRSDAPFVGEIPVYAVSHVTAFAFAIRVNVDPGSYTRMPGAVLIPGIFANLKKPAFAIREIVFWTINVVPWATFIEPTVESKSSTPSRVAPGRPLHPVGEYVGLCPADACRA